MTPHALPGVPPDQSLPPSWWAPGIALAERLAAPDPPPAEAPCPAARTGRPAELEVLDALSQGGFAPRLAGLGVPEASVAALRTESPERLGRRVAKPGWAHFIEEALAPAPAAGPDFPSQSFTAEADGAAVFAPAMRLLCAAADRYLARRLPADSADAESVNLESVREQMFQWLGRRLAAQAARTLVLELDRARAAGRLSGDDSRERFADYLRQTAAPPGLTALFSGYPVLARMLGQICRGTAAATAELLIRFAADRERIVAELLGGRDPGALITIEPGRGDPHQDGRSATLLRFADGSAVMYKPRPLDQHLFLDRMTGWLDGKVPGLCPRTPVTVAGDGYGWLEFIEFRPCRSVPEVARFYRRQGALMAMLHALDGVDMHYENLIACGDQPVPVDAETLLHPTIPDPALTGPDPAGAALADSVHRTSMLPRLLIGEHGAVDISAVGGEPGGTMPSTSIGWAAAGTDLMRVVRRPMAFEGSSNRPVLEGGSAACHDFEAALTTGFRAGYDAIVAHREEVTGPGGLLESAGAASGRLIARPSRLYATLLAESTHPDLLRDALPRDAVFSVLWVESAGDPARQPLIEHEIADLWTGDVPVFFHRPAAPDVRDSRGSRITGVLQEPAVAATSRKIARMSEVDRHDQEWIISATLATTRVPQGVPHRRSGNGIPTAPAVAPHPQPLLAAACGIADEIVARAVHAPGRANWLGLELVDDTFWSLLPMGAGLGQGYSGVALFFAQLGRLTGCERYTGLARQALAELPELIGTLAAEPELCRAVGPGAFEGLGGVCYALARTTTLLGDDLDSLVSAALDALGHAAAETGQPSRENTTGMSTGLAGALAAARAVHQERGLARAAELADEFADRLLVRATPAPGRGSGDGTGDGGGAGEAAGPSAVREAAPATVPGHASGYGYGFAHGDAGVGWALLRHTASAGGPHAAAGSALLRQVFTEVPAHAPETSWCSGVSGALLAAGGHSGDERTPLLDSVRTDRWVRLLTEQPVMADLSLCHGEFGTLEALSVLAATGHDGAAAGLARRSGLVLGSLQRHGHRCGTPGNLTSPGLLTGLSGIGYALLRNGFAETVPSVLLLDPTPAPLC